MKFWAILGAALLLRLFLLPIPNDDDDTVFQTWSKVVTVEGIHAIYDVYDPVANPPRECQYPPGYLFVLKAVGAIYQRFFSPEFRQETIAYLMMLRVPAVLADLTLAVLIFLAIGRWWGQRAAHFAFAAYALSPVMILDSTIVTQIDAVQSLLMAGTVLLLIAGRNASSIACLALAALTKPQAIVLAPLVLAVVHRRGDRRGFLRGAAAAAGIFLLLALPFLLNGRLWPLLRTVLTPVGTVPHLSLMAFNLWWLVSGGRGSLPDTTALAGPLTPRLIGLVLFAACVLIALRRVRRDGSRDSLLLASAFTAFAFFVCCTEMAERYILACLPFFLLLAPSARRFAGVYAALSVTAFLNIYAVFPLVALWPWEALRLPHSNFFHYPERLPVLRLLRPDAQPALPLLIAAAHVALLAWLAKAVWSDRTRPGRGAGG